MHLHQRLGWALAASVLAGGGVAFAATSSSPGPHTVAHHAVATSLTRRFAVFAHPRPTGKPHGHAASVGTATSLPAAVVASFSDPAQASRHFGPDAAAAVYVTPNPKSQFGFWVVPGSDGVCLVWQTTAIWPTTHAACGPLSIVNGKGLSDMSSVDGPQVVFGVVPNGVASVAVTNTDGSKVSSPVVNNAYVVVNPVGKPTAVEASGSAGAAQPIMDGLSAAAN